jgi:polyphenol oxidase
VFREEVSPRKTPFFQFTPLKNIPYFIHGTSTRKTDAALGLNDSSLSEETARAYLEGMGVGADVAVGLIRQVHSSVCRDLAAHSSNPAIPEEADGLIVNRSGVIGMIRTADCLPIIAIDAAARVVALFHAGWRGTRDRIVERGLRQMLQAGADPVRVVCAIGPSIRVCCYEVGEEVRRGFAEAGHELEPLIQGSRLDLVEANVRQMERSGVSTVYDSGLCTVCRSDLFYSYRRDKTERRMWTFAGFLPADG